MSIKLQIGYEYLKKTVFDFSLLEDVKKSLTAGAILLHFKSLGSLSNGLFSCSGYVSCNNKLK